MDFFNDQGALLVKLLHDQPVPDFVKAGELGGSNMEYSVDGLPATSFADPARRLYPCHTPADTYVSAAYYHAKSASPNADVEFQLRRFARIHAVEQDVDDVRRVAVAYRERKAAKLNKTAAPARWMVKNAAVSMVGEGSASLQRAAEEFVANPLQYRFEARQDVAGQLLKAAADTGAELPFELNVYTGASAVDLDRLQSALTKRALFLNDPNDKRALLGQVEVIQNVGTSEQMPTFGAKMAVFLDVFDRDHGLVRHYGRGLPDPHRSVFVDRPVDKTAAFGEQEFTVNGRTLKIADVDPEVGRWALGDDFSPERLLNLTELEQQRLAQYL